MNKQNGKSAIVIYGILALVVAYIANRAVGFYNVTHDLIALLNELPTELRAHPFAISLESNALIASGIGVLVVLGIVLYIASDTATRRPGEEYGSARWGTLAEAKNFENPKPTDNIILSKHIRMTTGRPKRFEFGRNLNVLVIGGSGSGKTTSSVIPNVWQYNSSYVLTDPKGTLLPQLGNGFLREGYHVISFSTMEFEHSMHYNPLAYIRKEQDVLSLIGVIMANTSGQGERKNEDFWVKSERMWLQAHIGYLWMTALPEELNFGSLLTLLDASEVHEEDESFVNAVDVLFEELEEEEPGNFACAAYREYKLAAGKTAKSILVSVAARLNPFTIPTLREITSFDEMNLDDIGRRKTALFVGVSATNSTYDFLVAMLLYQLIDRLTTLADVEYGGELPIQVQLILDEFANCIGKIPEFEKTIAVIRSQRINAWIYLQSLSQLTALYGKDAANVISDNCDWTLFLGGKSPDTTKMLSEMMGKQTIRGKNNTTNKGSSGGYSIADNGLGRELMTADEIGKMPRTKCLVLCSGIAPWMDDKFPIFDDPRFGAMKRDKLNVTRWIREGAPQEPQGKIRPLEEAINDATNEAAIKRAKAGKTICTAQVRFSTNETDIISVHSDEINELG